MEKGDWTLARKPPFQFPIPSLQSLISLHGWRVSAGRKVSGAGAGVPVACGVPGGVAVGVSVGVSVGVLVAVGVGVKDVQFCDPPGPSYTSGPAAEPSWPGFPRPPSPGITRLPAKVLPAPMHSRPLLKIAPPAAPPPPPVEGFTSLLPPKPPTAKLPLKVTFATNSRPSLKIAPPSPAPPPQTVLKRNDTSVFCQPVLYLPRITSRVEAFG